MTPALRPDAHLVFTDFDGTFADRGVIPDAHARATRDVQEAGHLVLLTTGRAFSILRPDILALFDGVISSAGAHVEVGGTVLSETPYPPELAERTVRVLQDHQALFGLEATGALYVGPGMREIMRPTLEPADRPTPDSRSVLGAMQEVEDLASQAFAKVFVWRSDVPVADLARQIGPGVRALPASMHMPGHHRGELQMTAVDKADGLRAVARHLQVPIARTVGVGDGTNDIEMLEAAGIAVGIIGGPPQLLRHADLLVPGPQDLGWATAMRRLGLLTKEPVAAQASLRAPDEEGRIR